MFIFIWLLFGIVAAIIGSKKGRAGSGFLLGIILGPFGVLIMIFIQGDRQVCLFCRELIHKDAIRCPHCHKELTFTTDELNQHAKYETEQQMVEGIQKKTSMTRTPSQIKIIKRPAFWATLVILGFLIFLLI